MSRFTRSSQSSKISTMAPQPLASGSRQTILVQTPPPVYVQAKPKMNKTLNKKFESLKPMPTPLIMNQNGLTPRGKASPPLTTTTRKRKRMAESVSFLKPVPTPSLAPSPIQAKSAPKSSIPSKKLIIFDDSDDEEELEIVMEPNTPPSPKNKRRRISIERVIPSDDDSEDDHVIGHDEICSDSDVDSDVDSDADSDADSDEESESEDGISYGSVLTKDDVDKELAPKQQTKVTVKKTDFACGVEVTPVNTNRMIIIVGLVNLVTGKTDLDRVITVSRHSIRGERRFIQAIYMELKSAKVNRIDLTKRKVLEIAHVSQSGHITTLDDDLLQCFEIGNYSKFILKYK